MQPIIFPTNPLPLRAMKKTPVLLMLVGVLLLAGACKSEFERVRVSGDAELVLKKAFEYYDKGGTPNKFLHQRIKKLNLTKQEKEDLESNFRRYMAEKHGLGSLDEMRALETKMKQHGITPPCSVSDIEKLCKAIETGTFEKAQLK